MTRKFFGTILSITVVLGIVSCSSEISRVRDNEIEITVSQAKKNAETFSTEESIKMTSEEFRVESSESEVTLEDTEQSTVVDVSESESDVEQCSTATSETDPEETKFSSQFEAPVSERTEKETEKKAPDPTATPIPTNTPTPVPTSTPVPTDTPTPIPETTSAPETTPPSSPEPTPFDIDQSAKEKGYVSIDIDMGDGKTQRIYGYYVDMSELATKINDYREGIGLSRLPTDSECVSEMKLRAAEATVKYSHWRPNGKGGHEANLSGGITPDEAYTGLYNSNPHRTSWEDTHLISIYCVGFRRMDYREDTGEWTGGGCATVVYFGDDLP